MLGDEIAIYLAGAGLGLVMASSSNGVFSSPWPTEAGDTATCVIEYAGRPALRTMGAALGAPVFEHVKFQVVSRDAPDNAMACRQLQQSIWKNLDHQNSTLTGTTGGTTLYGYIRALSSPALLKIDESGRVNYYANYEAYKQVSP